MSTYTITPAGDDAGFHIGVVGSDGARHTMLGFASMAEAEAWIEQDRRLTDVSTQFQEEEASNAVLSEESLA